MKIPTAWTVRNLATLTGGPPRQLNAACARKSFEQSRGASLRAAATHPTTFTNTLVRDDKPSTELDSSTAYEGKKLSELLTGYFVFQLCSKDFIVNNQIAILKWARRLLGDTIFRHLMKKTIYGQFLAGETDEEVLATCEKFASHNIRSMFTYTAAEGHGTGRRTFNEEEVNAEIEENFQQVLNCVNIAASSRGSINVSPKISTKITFISTASFIKELSSVVSYNNSFLTNSPSRDTDVQLLVKDVHKKCRASRELQGLNWTRKLEIEALPSCMTHLPFHLEFTEQALNKLQNYCPEVIHGAEELREETAKVQEKMNAINQAGLTNGVCITWDAEQTYLQCALDILVIDSMRRFNRKRPVVLNTYQCYLKEALYKVRNDMDVATREGFCFGAKIVRGAYLQEERRLADIYGHEDPVNPTYEATSTMYEDVMDHILEKVSERPEKYVVTFGSHNEETCRRVMSRMKDLELYGKRHNISIAQLIGMRDHLTFALSQTGVPVEKLLHYGPVIQGIAYMSRRLNENRSGMAAADTERILMEHEIKSRLRRALMR